MSLEILKRADVKKENTWATEDLYATDALWEEDLKKLSEYGDKIATFEGKLMDSADNLYNYFKLSDELDVLTDNLFNYASRKSDEDTKNNFYQAMFGKAYSELVKVESRSAFFEPELLAADESVIEGFYKEKPELEVYRIAINDVVRMKAHILSPEEERILALAGEISEAPGNINSMLNNADMKYPSIKDADGNELRVTHGSFIPLLESKDENVRRAAFESLYHTYADFKNTSASILSAQVKQLIFFAKSRHYNSTLEAALDGTNVPVSVYKNLIEAVHDNMHYMHKYVRLRKKLMKKDELHMYDLYTSIVPTADAKIPFEEAKKTVLEAVKPLGEEYQSILKEGFDNRWIDIYENEGKRSGAYSAGALVHPYVLLNYKETLDSQFTLAHEMGHALHSYYSNHTQPTCYRHYRIFVAEVASTCNEALLMEHLLAKTTDKMERAYLINYFLEQFRTTLYRQTMFAEFEMKINEMVENGESLTADELCKLYRELNIEYYGEDIVVDHEIDMEWARIPHFYYNFYVFQYATGYSAAIALSRRILNEGESAVKDYLGFLKGGCSKDPVSLLRGAGVDMATKEPVNAALKLFGKLIDELDELLAE
ncbi:oligoendopeptidase F [Falcatimonas sp. MSJ-15]|uniref:oligoendopeptidase F n=1 Tax=Falcatimonas sp. MSJ-15 TaxID=2841515 RepID=UPI001C128AB2|nr:oligoendopeptidase F [Falcatimonas sp. MSJ-15]MBU5468901.1 oligoendopeptidase F [Falcatimonas sp. MSJ-15]